MTLQVAILAGGLGTRLKPFTDKVPKVMLEVSGRPFLEHQFHYLKKFGFRKFLLLVSYLRRQIEAYFQEGRKLGVQIEYSCEEEPMGTGGALKLAAPRLDEKFILINGDTFYPLDYHPFLKEASSVREGMLMAVYDNQDAIASNNVRVEKNGLISAYSRTIHEGMNGVDGGVSFLNKGILEYIPAGEKISLESEIFPLLISKGLLKAYLTNTRYYDMGTLDRLELVKKILS